MSIPEIQAFQLLDGTSIPWIAWGTWIGDDSKDAGRFAKLALASGIRHIDTAQSYSNEKETGDAIQQSSVSQKDIYLASKSEFSPNTKDNKEVPVPLSEVAASVESSINRLGFIPNLYLMHNPFVAHNGELKAVWKVLEDLKSEGKLHSIGVSNFRPQDLEEILDGAKYKPVVNQLEYHPYTLAHLELVLALQAKHGIVTESYGALTPVVRHPTGGPLKPVLERIAQRISKITGKEIDSSIVLLLWVRAQGVVAVTTSANPDRINSLGEIATLPNLLEQSEVDEITTVGKSIHYRYYVRLLLVLHSLS
ncbi:conjugated polyketone reductase C1 [Crassisporium funariophilum]|nr:conjugated polyketone reductase C1 [Crassisporium funariophilum]